MRFIVLILGSFMLLAPLAAAPGADMQAPPAIRTCAIPDMSRATRCAIVSVPEDRLKPTGKRIDLNVVIVEAPAPALPDPIIFFAGGPGQGAATLAAGLMRELEPVAGSRHVVLIDQRGTGQSNALTCADGFLLIEGTRVDDLKHCRETLARAADLNQYGTDASADDVADVLRFLGIRRVNVVAASYGTRLAFRFMSRHPHLVRTSVLRAVAPPEFNTLRDGAQYAHAALLRVFEDCRGNRECNNAFPSLAADYAQLRLRLKTTRGALSLDAFDRTLYAMLLSTSSRQTIPWVVHTAAAGGLDMLTNIAASLEAVYRTVAVGEYLSVVCSEDAPEAGLDTRRDDFDAATAAVAAACAHWPVTATQGKVEQRLNMPALVFSGELDPAMPAAVGSHAMRHLERGTHIVLPATAHGPMFPGCATALAREFISSGGTVPLDRNCVDALVPPPFKIK
jgi:pimeloyl-ACP methyl ester carboxylesterase